MLAARGTSLPGALDTGNPPCPFGGLPGPTASPPRFSNVLRCRILLPACHRLRLLRPRLRTRLTLGRLTVPRNPQAFGGGGSHTTYATHSGIRTSHRSTSPSGLASLLENAPLPDHGSTLAGASTTSTASVGCLSLDTLSVHAHSTSELLRTLSMMAASKPTSWLFSHTHPLAH